MHHSISDTQLGLPRLPVSGSAWLVDGISHATLNSVRRDKLLVAIVDLELSLEWCCKRRQVRLHVALAAASLANI